MFLTSYYYNSMLRVMHLWCSITLVTICHILSAAMQVMKMSKLKDIPVSELVDENTWMLPAVETKQILSQISRKIMDFISLPEPSLDGVYAYGVEVLSLGLFYMLFKDAIKEGNVEKVLKCWKYFVPIFKASGCTNYSIEAFLSVSIHFHLDNPTS